ncbi:MAG: hypothetical protein J6X25_09755 [Bacteroidales bacterium]|nr:hypothetical protein [Bacteroidales bacterium]
MNILRYFFSGLGRSGRSSSVKVNEDSLLEMLASDSIEPKKLFGLLPWQVPYQKGLRFTMIITTLIVVVTFVLYYSFVYVKEVLLFENGITTNAHGALTPRKSCGREYAMFLFNASDIWYNSGIHISKGDKVRISISGAFHSSIEDLYLDAVNNSPTPKYEWIGQEKRAVYSKEPPSEENLAFCLDPTNSYFGAVLYAVVPEYLPNDPLLYATYKNKWEPRSSYKAKHISKTDGILHFAVNDIYFKDFGQLQKYCDENKETLGKEITADKDDYHRLFYYDNLGQILVCVEIQHPLRFGIINPRTVYRDFESHLEYCRLHCAPFWGTCQIVLYFFFIVIWIALILAFWVIASNLAIYIIFLLGYWLSCLWKAIIKHA